MGRQKKKNGDPQRYRWEGRRRRRMVTPRDTAGKAEEEERARSATPQADPGSPDQEPGDDLQRPETTHQVRANVDPSGNRAKERACIDPFMLCFFCFRAPPERIRC